ncbi:MAG: septum formation inhibitor Maf [Sinobacteraceae bacterium]|nr:septum formation inhibitor Maf [Nevskiaceae bacterium]
MTIESSAPVLCLASASPRRRELLWQIGVPHLVQPADLDERCAPNESPADYVARLARAKAQAIHAARTREASHAVADLPVLGADTTVSIDGLILGKPADRAALHAMLGRLSAREHEVWSAVALVGASGVDTRLSCTRVKFRALQAAEIDRYWQSGEPCDKAGGYAIQGLGAVFVERIEGSFSGVVGLPLAETAAMLVAAGVPLWQAGA